MIRLFLKILKNPKFWIVIILASSTGAGVFFFYPKFGTRKVVYFFERIEEEIANIPQVIEEKKVEEKKGKEYPWHKNITATVFWIGEKASDDNEEIANKNSAWDDNWREHFGGTDNPKKRNGYWPAGFTPQENPFYIALPYNDFNKNGKRKPEAQKLIPWYSEKKWTESESACKNRWIKIKKGNKVVYGQWEDVGPFNENDSAYVFGNAKPKNQENKNAGIDVSPAVRDYLNLSGIDKVDWQFVDEIDVPEGEWKKIVTKSGISWK